MNNQDYDKLNLNAFFSHVKKSPYAIVKMDERFPRYVCGGDIDVFCYDVDDFSRKIIAVGNSYVAAGYVMAISDNESAYHVYIDFFYADKLEFRFDLHRSMPPYEKIHVKEHFFYSVIENAVDWQKEFNGEKYSLYVAAETDDLVIRYAEYLEWYERRPDKIKHLDYIIAKTQGESSKRIGFFDKLHAYTKLPVAKMNRQKNSTIIFRFRQIVYKTIKVLANTPCRKVPGVFMKALRVKLLKK